MEAVQKFCIAGTSTKACTESRMHFYDYGINVQKRDSITPFPVSSAIVGPNFESKNIISQDWIMCNLYERDEKKAIPSI